MENSLAKALPVAIGFMANLAGIGGITEKIKDVIKKLRQPIDKAVEKVVNFVADKARALMGRKEEPATTEKKESPEKTEKVSHGLTAIDQEEQKYLEKNKISRDEAEKVAVAVKRAHPVFKSLTVVDGGDTWDYEYVASPGRIKKGEKKLEGKINDEFENGIQANKRRFNVKKQESPVWRSLSNVKGKDRKTIGTGKYQRYFEWDNTHNDIEVYDNRGKHLGSMDPITGKMYKPAVKGRKIEI